MKQSSAKTQEVSLKAFDSIPIDNEQFPLPYIHKHRAIIVSKNPEELVIGMIERLSDDLVSGIAQLHKRKVRCVFIKRAELLSFLERNYSASSAKLGAWAFEDKNAEDAPQAAGEEGNEPSAREQAPLDELANADDAHNTLDTIAHNAPVLNLVNSILIDAASQDVTDVHIEVIRGNAAVRYRKDGRLQTVQQYPRSYFKSISSRLKVMASLDIMESRLPQDGRISIVIQGKKYDVRMSVLPAYSAESIVLRILQERDESVVLTDLGFSSANTKRIEEVLRYREGLFLVTGPTGSGKTTTLHTILNAIKEESDKVITIEDPVEYVCPGISQIQTSERIGLTFESLLKRVLRHDPDIIMVGEVRDGETAQLVARSALTGHLVFSTLHTDGALGVVPRLRDMGVPPYMISAILRGVISQRLVRRICSACKPKKNRVSKKNCAQCKGSGYSGRVLLEEVLVIDNAIRGYIASEKFEKIAGHITKTEHISLAEDAKRKIAKGMTSAEEVQRHVAEVL